MSSDTQDQNHSPGTFLLITERDSGEAGHSKKSVILDPVPSTDPNDPLNWTTIRKTINFALVLAVTASIFSSLSIQIIFWQQMSVDLGLTFGQLNNSTSVMFVGLSLGCLLFIPLARKFGRRPIYLVSTAVMAAMSFWTSEMTSLGELYGTNLLFGLAGATNEAIVQITVSSSTTSSLEGHYADLCSTSRSRT
jgi:MFS family permease